MVSGLVGVLSVSASHVHNCAVLDDGSAWCWGDNAGGQLGDGTTSDSTTPVPVSGLGSVTAISTGALKTCAVLADQSAWCWGSSYLGDGTADGSSVPVQVSNLAGVVAEP
jgi:alpha-tubulin suppressor-like RCC1 family protein